MAVRALKPSLLLSWNDWEQVLGPLAKCASVSLMAKQASKPAACLLPSVSGNGMGLPAPSLSLTLGPRCPVKQKLSLLIPATARKRWQPVSRRLGKQKQLKNGSHPAGWWRGRGVDNEEWAPVQIAYHRNGGTQTAGACPALMRPWSTVASTQWPSPGKRDPHPPQ